MNRRLYMSDNKLEFRIWTGSKNGKFIYPKAIALVDRKWYIKYGEDFAHGDFLALFNNDKNLNMYTGIKTEDDKKIYEGGYCRKRKSMG